MAGVDQHGFGVIRSQGQELPSSLNKDVHLMPCHIAFTGPAPVSDYFRPKSTGIYEGGLEVQEASFRGRRLFGSMLEIPEGYDGLVLERDPSSLSNANDELDIWNTKATFGNVTYWQHDTRPSATDPLPQSMDWLRLASVMHKAVSGAEVSAMEKTITMPKDTSQGRKRKDPLN